MNIKFSLIMYYSIKKVTEFGYCKLCKRVLSSATTYNTQSPTPIYANKI